MLTSLLFFQNDNKEATGVFKVRIEKLQKRKVKLPQYDQPVYVPAFLVDACNFLRGRLETDGLFRKPGVAARQKEIKVTQVLETATC